MERNEYTGAKECTPYHIGPFALLDIIRAIDEHNGLVTALATVFVAGLTWTLYRATTEQGRLTRESIELSRQEFVSTHRPKIIVRQAIIGSVLEGEQIGVMFTLANVGETPGRIVRSVVDIEGAAVGAGPRLFVHNSVEPFNEIGDLTLMPGEERIMAFEQLTKRPHSAQPPAWNEAKYGLHTVRTRVRDPISRQPISGEQTHRLQELYLGGQLLYSGAAGTVRRTAFFRKLIPERQRFYRVPHEPDLEYAD